MAKKQDKASIKSIVRAPKQDRARVTVEAILESAVQILETDGLAGFKVAALAEHAGLMLAPHFAMELHVHLAAAYPSEPWVEHFDWLEPLFNERLEISHGRMLVPTRPGLGLSLSEQARAWTRESHTVGLWNGQLGSA